jgi:hypothetical protein
MDPELIDLINELIKTNNDSEKYRIRFDRLCKAINNRKCSLCNNNLTYNEYKYNIEKDI